MARSRRSAAGVGTLVGLLLAASSGWAAEAPASRAAKRQQTERRIAGLEERLATFQAQPANPADEELGQAGANFGLTDLNLNVARQHLQLARKLLGHNNTTAAQHVTEQAERFLALAEGKAEGSLPLVEAKGVQE